MRLAIRALRLVGRIIISSHYGLIAQMLDGLFLVSLIWDALLVLLRVSPEQNGIIYSWLKQPGLVMGLLISLG
jgi:hypothetical protein